MERLLPQQEKYIEEYINGKRQYRGLEPLEEGALYYECTSVVYCDDEARVFSYDIYINGEFIGIMNSNIEFLPGTCKGTIFWTNSISKSIF
jgi:hypothetical protein